MNLQRRKPARSSACALATAVGVSATVPVHVGELPEDLSARRRRKSVDELIAAALARRPDLAAERYRALAARSHIHVAAIEGLPSLSLDASGNRTFYWRSGIADPFATNWAGALTLRIPLFRGFDTAYQVRRAREEAEAADAAADRTENEVVLYWSSTTQCRRPRGSDDRDCSPGNTSPK